MCFRTTEICASLKFLFRKVQIHVKVGLLKNFNWSQGIVFLSHYKTTVALSSNQEHDNLHLNTVKQEDGQQKLHVSLYLCILDALNFRRSLAYILLPI